MFNPLAYDNSRPDGFGVLEIATEPAPDATRCFVPLRRSELHGEVLGPLAGLRLVQVFGFAEAPASAAVEAVYRFPLPGDAAVSAVHVRFGEVEIRARLEERTQAETEYAEARAQGRQAAMLTRESPDVFTLQVAGLVPGVDVTVETSYVQLARPEGAGWSLRLPLTTAPRYVRDDEATGRHALGQPLALLRDPGHRFRLDLTFRGAGWVRSVTHALNVSDEPGRKRVQLEAGEVVPDRDCVLSWEPARAQRPALQTWMLADPQRGWAYFLALVAAPARGDRGKGASREVVLLVDHSGSMQGAKWAAADWSVEKFLAGLGERDSFALGLFHDRTRWFADAPRPATAKNVQAAVAFLKAQRDQGGTQLGVALEQALGMPRGSGEQARHVLIVTDAEVSDAGRILRLADGETGRADRRRISVLCIDAAPNALLAEQLAEAGGGVARFLTSRPDEEDIATALDEILADWDEPVQLGLRLEVNRAGAEAAGRAVSPAAAGSLIDLGDLPAGRPLWVVGRVLLAGTGPLTLRLSAGRGVPLAEGTPAAGEEQAAGRALKALFGARRVRGLEYLMHSYAVGEEFETALRRLGYDPAQLTAAAPAKVYAENQRDQSTAALRALLVREALDYGLASAETAFVATRQEEGQPVTHRVVVANALPAAWSEPFAVGGQGGFFGSILGCAGGVTLSGQLCVDADPDTTARAAAPPVARPAGRLMNKVVSALGQRRSAAPAAAPTASPAAPTSLLFVDVPAVTKGEAVLFDSDHAQSQPPLPEEGLLTALSVRFPGTKAVPAALDEELALHLYLDDLVTPRAKVRLADLLRHGGRRPLNLRRQRGQRLRVVLADPAGAWKDGAPRLEVSLAWES
jgi:Ca-activated chloride channel family protein